MSGKRIVDLCFDLAERPRSIPSILANKGNVELVLMSDCALITSPITERNDRRLRNFFARVNHALLQVDRLELAGDTGQISRNRMAMRTIARAVEEFFPSLCISGQQFCHRIIARYMAAVKSRIGLMVQERHDIAYLIIGQSCKTGHAFIRASIADHGPDQISVIIMAQNGGTNQIWSARAGCIFTVTESAGGTEECLAALYGCRILRRFLSARGRGRLVLLGSLRRGNQGERGDRAHRESISSHKTSVFQIAQKQLRLSQSAAATGACAGSTTEAMARRCDTPGPECIERIYIPNSRTPRRGYVQHLVEIAIV